MAFTVVRWSGYSAIKAPNESKFFHADLILHMQELGLFARDKKIGLISERRAVIEFMKQHSEAYFLSIAEDDADVIWDVTQTISPELCGEFDGLICQSLLEHVIDPCFVIQEMLMMLKPEGVLAIQVPLPTFKYHATEAYPDCMRFFPDFFEGIGKSPSWPATCLRTLTVRECLIAYLQRS